MQMLNYHTMTISGITKTDYPLFHAVMYQYHVHIALVLVSIWFVAWVTSLKQQSNIRYQLNQMCAAVIFCTFSMFVSPANTLSARYGRFWYFIPMAQTAYNDAFAYFAGKMFGRHKLIKVSPNKTVEGFFGGLVGNFITTLIICHFVF